MTTTTFNNPIIKLDPNKLRNLTKLRRLDANKLRKYIAKNEIFH